MAISIALPSALQPHARGIGVVKVESRGTTLRDALAALRVTYPGIVERVLTEQGQVREHVNLFVGEENSRFIGGLEAPVADGETIEIVPSVSGG
jgi:molybdopterin converting factor small subunit